MSLIHWWPLNGNLNDIGIKTSLLTMNNVPSTQYINGKIGQCYNFDGSAWGQVSNVSVGTDCTICCWAKTPSTAATMLWGMQCTGSDYMNLFNSWRICLNVGDSEDNPFKDSSDNDIPQIHDDVWHHFVVVFKGSEKAKLYIDGVYRGQAVTYRNPTMNNQNFTIGTWNYSSHGYYWTGGINDVRIYDHALSQKEVKEISKGLVLHYNFEDPYAEGTTNLNSANWNPYSSYWTISSQTVNEITLVSQGTSHGTVAIYNESVRGQLSANTTYTISGYLYRDGAPYKCTDSTLTPYDGWITSKFESKDDGFFSYTGYFTSPTSDVWIIHTPLFGAPESGVVCKIKNMQWEQKDHATPYVNGTRPNDLIYDNSGYGYNGTQVDCSIVEPSDNTSGKCSLLTNTSGYVQMPNIYLDTTFTISTWCKHLDSFSTWARIFDFGNATQGQDYDIGFATSDTSGSMYVFGRCGSGTTLPDSYVGVMDYNWHLWTLTVDGVFIKLYKDGELIKEFSSYYNVGGVLYTLNYLNKSNWSGDGVSNKYYTDFKIFATALSASDILAEYNRKASIDRNGNLFTGEIIEVNSEELLPGTQIGSDAISVRPGTAGSASQITNTADGSLQMTNQVWGWTNKFNVNYGETLYYDIEFSNVQNDLFYLGFEQFDDAGNSGSNEMCWYIIATADAHDHTRVKGTMTITDKTDANTNVTKWRLRLLNDWNGVGGSMIATIHHLSLRRLSSLTQAEISKKNTIEVNTFREDNTYVKTGFTKDGFIFSKGIEEC